MTPEDVQTTRENHQMLSLTEHPLWGVFVRMADEDLKQLDKISSLVVEGKTKEQIADEVLLRYQTRETVISYINNTILRAESALQEVTEQSYVIINNREEV